MCDSLNAVELPVVPGMLQSFLWKIRNMVVVMVRNNLLNIFWASSILSNILMSIKSPWGILPAEMKTSVRQLVPEDVPVSPKCSPCMESGI